MATAILRRPGSLARYARRPANLTPLASAPASSPFIRHLRLSPLNTARRIRYYSSEPPNQNPNDRKPPASEPAADKQKGQLSKGDREVVEELLQAVNHDKELVAEFLRDSKQTLPERDWKALEAACEKAMKDGLPPEFKKVMTARKKRDEPLTALEHLRATGSMMMQMWKQGPGGSAHVDRSSGEKGTDNKVSGENEKAPESKEDQGKNDTTPEGKEEKETSDGAGDKERNAKNGKSSDKEKQKQGQEKEQGKKDGSGKQPKKPLPNVYEFKFDTASLLISTILTYYFWQVLFPGETNREITWQEFRANFFDKGLVQRLTVLSGSKVRVELDRDAVSRVYADSPAADPGFHYYFSIGSIESFDRRIDEAHNELGVPSSERIPVSYTTEVPWFSALISFGPTLLFFGGLAWMSKRVSGGGNSKGGIFGMGKSRARRFNHESDIKIKFSDVAGMDEAKVEIMEFVSFLKQPERFKKLGAKIPRGAILSGPPGTGKTLLAKATAGESGVPFFSVSGSEFIEMFVGVGASRVRDLFANARKNTPCIVFIDEIDAIGKSRSKKSVGGGNDERESTLNQILTEMDGFNTTDQVVVLAGTNRPDVLDKALMRPGRFDRHIAIESPTLEGRKQIFGVHLSRIVTSEDLEYLKGRLSALTPGFSGADIANCVNEAALVAARDNADTIVMDHFERAIERVVGGLERKSLVLSPDQKRVVAYHEAGHAICGWFFRWADPLLKVSIIPRGQGLGYAQYLPGGGGDMFLMDNNQLMDRMAMALGGRVSEELHFESVTSGASDDFNKVTRMANMMVTKYGMSKLRYIYYEDDPSSQLHKPFSDETARDIDNEVRRIVEDAYKQCHQLLTEKRAELDIVARELLSKEVLSRDDLIRLLGPRPWPESGEFTKYFDGRAGQTVAPPAPHPTPEDTQGKDGNDQPSV